MAYSVVLKRGDMLGEEWAEFVVNPSNTSLILGSGVSAALQNLCGRELQKEMDSAKEQAGEEIKQGVVLLTPSTCDKFAYILHAAVMDYAQKRRAFGEANPTLQTIETMLFNIESILLAHCQSRKNTKGLERTVQKKGVAKNHKIKNNESSVYTLSYGKFGSLKKTQKLSYKNPI